MAQTRLAAPRGASTPLAEYKGTASSVVSVRMGTASSTTSSTTPSATSSSRPTTRMRTSLYALDNSSNEAVCKRGFCFAASTGPTAEVKAVLKHHIPVEMSSAEFGNLPPAIQRKVSFDSCRLITLAYHVREKRKRGRKRRRMRESEAFQLERTFDWTGKRLLSVEAAKNHCLFISRSSNARSPPAGLTEINWQFEAKM